MILIKQETYDMAFNLIILIQVNNKLIGLYVNPIILHLKCLVVSVVSCIVQRNGKFGNSYDVPKIILPKSP